jgi:hypothetical protein
MSAKLSEETVRALLAEKNWEPVEGWEYVNARSPIPGRCLVCGYEGPGPRYGRLAEGTGACIRCAGQEKPSDGTVRALLAEKNWEPSEPLQYVNANTPIPGRCLVEGCGYEGPGPRYNGIQKGQGACIRCSGIEKDSNEVVRALLTEKNWEPVEGWEYVNANTPIPGRCLVEGCGYEGPGSRYGSLKNGTGACIRCSGIEKVSNETVRALLGEKNWEPVEGWEYSNANTPIPGRCFVEGCGYEGPGPTYGHLKQGLGACIRCSGKEKISNETVRALLAEKNWESVEGWEYVNNATPIPGRCLICGYKSGSDKGPRYRCLKNGQGACPSCAESGYDPNKPGWFYRFEFPYQGFTFLCYGITNVVDQRMKQYERKLDVQNFQSIYFEDGSVPQEIEGEFHEIRKQSSTPASTCGVAGTITESFSLSPENWELLTVFEAHWLAAEKQAA